MRLPHRILGPAALAVALMSTQPAGAGPNARASRDAWLAGWHARPPFSFTLGGRHSAELLADWSRHSSRKRLDRNRTEQTETYTDPATGLQVRSVAVVYGDFPVVEWTVWLRNGGSKPAPVLADVRALDAPLAVAEGPLALRRWTGSPCREDDYEPRVEPLQAGKPVTISAAGGRPTNSDLCYFQLDGGSNGLLMGLGWPGQWDCTFIRGSDGAVRISAGQQVVRVALQPGEQIRTPRVTLLFRQGGDWIDGQNSWRRWMIAHNLPRPGGSPVPTHYGGCFGNPLPRAAEEIAQYKQLREDAGGLDVWFIDAGWYPCGDGWWNVGTWSPDPVRFPRGLGEVGTAVHNGGSKFVVWFEVERVTPGSWMATEHPDWVLGGAAGGLLNLGDRRARDWAIENVDRMLREGHIDILRVDYNIDPLAYWQGADGPDRQGYTENAYVQGLLAYWDEILRRRPDLYIDTCASGGRRNDLEILRRAVPLLRSDWAVAAFTPAGAIGQQAQTYGISSWMPYHGTGAPSGDPYVMRSSFAPAFRMGWDTTVPNRDVAMLRRTIGEFRQVERTMMGDFYPLTPYSRAKSDWMAWQYHVPSGGHGSVMAFRRDECRDASLAIRLRGLKPRTRYLVTSLDGGEPVRMTGRDLMAGRYALRIDANPGSAILVYREEVR